MKGKTLRICYKIKKEANIEYDKKGNPIESFNCIYLDTKSYTIDKRIRKQIIRECKQYISEEYGIKEKYIVPITLNEYLDELELKHIENIVNNK